MVMVDHQCGKTLCRRGHRCGKPRHELRLNVAVVLAVQTLMWLLLATINTGNVLGVCLVQVREPILLCLRNIWLYAKKKDIRRVVVEKVKVKVTVRIVFSTAFTN
jgi:hypothetical protein